MRVREVLAAWKSGRKQGGKREATKGNTVYFLNIDYLTAAKAALACDAYFTALLYVEQHSEQQNGQVVPLEAAGMPALRLHHDAPPESEVLLQKQAQRQWSLRFQPDANKVQIDKKFLRDFSWTV